MQGLADGYFIIPYTIGNYLSSQVPFNDNNHNAFKESIDSVNNTISRFLNIKGNKTVDEIQKN